MLTKTSELTGAALVWAVAKCEGLPLVKYDRNGPWYVGRDIVGFSFKPTVNWAQGGPIIERECIDLNCDEYLSDESRWEASVARDGVFEAFGPTPLIAAMRCYVASKLGDTVDILESLTPYAIRVRQLENAGATTSDAQGIADAEVLSGTLQGD